MTSFNSEQSPRKYSTVGTETQYKVMHDLFQSHREGGGWAYVYRG